MSLKDMYNEIAGQYSTANRFGSISQSHACAIEQIQYAQLGQHPDYRVLDLGVGNGRFLSKVIDGMPDAHFTGIDISSEMLTLAKKILPNLVPIEASAADASQFMPVHSQDLVVAHFINAYIPIHILFSQAALMTRSTGYFSFITTTYESFPVAQQYLADFMSTRTLCSAVVGHYYKAMVKNTTVAANQQELLAALDTHHFEVMAHQRINLPVILNNMDELASFGIEGTWFLNTMSVKMLPKAFLINRMKRLIEKIFVFPYQDTHVIDVVLARKR